MTTRNDQSLAFPKDDMLDIPQPGGDLPSIIPPTTNEMVTMMLRSAGTLEITDGQKEILFAPVDPEMVEIRPDGLIYLPAIEYREKLCQAFGVGWALLPAEPKPQREGNLIVWPHYLFIQGQPIALVYGEQAYQPNNYTMTYGDAIEGAASNALMRVCKRIGVNRELWRPSFIRQWVKRYAESYIVQSGRNQGKTQWRKKEIFADPDVIDSEPDAVPPEKEAIENEEKSDSADNDFWRRKAFQHAGDLGMTDDAITELCHQHLHQVDFETGDYARDDAGERIPVTEKKQVHWLQWKKVAQHLYDTWVAAGRPEKSKPETEEQGDQEDPPETGAETPEQPDTQAGTEEPQDAPKESTQQDEDQKKRRALQDRFLDMARKQFPDEQERGKWINDKVGPANDLAGWDSKLFENGIKLLSADDEPITAPTVDAIRDALKDDPDYTYQTMRSVAFKEFAAGIIERKFAKLTECNEAEGQAILDALPGTKPKEQDATGEQEQADGAAFIEDS